MRIIGRASWLAASVFLVASTLFTTVASADLTLADVLKALPSCSVRIKSSNRPEIEVDLDKPRYHIG